MKSVAQMAKDLDISSSTIREYLSRFEEFFPDPVEHDGLKEYPPEAEELVQKIYGYYQNSGMTKEEIRVKLGGPQASDQAAPVAMMGAPMDMEKFDQLSERLERLIGTIENLTAALTGASVDSLKVIRKKASSESRLNEISEKLSDLMDLSKVEEVTAEDVEKKVLEADGTVVFSFGKLTANALDSINFAKAHKKPWIHIDLETEKNPAKVLRTWLPQFDIKKLNVAGRSASRIPGLKRSIDDMISLVFGDS
jgi:DNA-binding transcriptional MerR regulator